ncbi:sialate O-acetylesterase [Hymenobacter sp. HMF4947]|uniref:Sialate O-acetylesterase n=1 Tax=Hymenobacter ginkgonis TaxID=2682976 RepID=A0A7K1T971_9BACT|nr:sialate O-acetylesterase [Hymenobacter ginkgonis]MVN74959.1 sialate O-acetylesterase [Hymenobacter ginkgonis]
MMRRNLLWLGGWALALLPAAGLRAQALKPRVREVVHPPAQRSKFRLYLLVGQSNMAGRGTVEAQDTLPNRHVLRLNPAGQWEVAKDPLHFDKPVAGVGPGLAFGRAMAAADTSLVIGLIPCAVGGSGIDAWAPGAYFAGTQTHPYDDALARARTAQATGTLAGIIWHQGETDSNPDKSPAYAAKLAALIAQFRADLPGPTLPFVAGQLPAFQFTKTGPDGVAHPNPDAGRVNEAVAGLGQTVRYYAFVPANGTTDRGDQLHFDAASTRLLGRRYAQAMLRLQRQAPRRP